MMVVHEVCFNFNFEIFDVVILGNRYFQITCFYICLAVHRVKGLLFIFSHKLVMASLLFILENQEPFSQIALNLLSLVDNGPQPL
jgi:hypothetical protein